MPENRNEESDKLKVFISYSRRDLDFADQIVALLSWQGFIPSIDREGIHGAENWERRLSQLILEADIVVFVLSPDSVASSICDWEVEEALRRGKRIIPILSRPLGDQKPHDHLRDLNYIYFYADKDFPESGFGTGLVRFTEALTVDVQWLREHTRLEELAARWDEGDRDSDLLVRGSELEACNNWRNRRPSNASELTSLQRTFLTASENEELARTNIELRRLEEIDAAQNERQTAIEERELAVKRELEAQKARKRANRLIGWGSSVAAVLVAIAALLFAQVKNDSAIMEKLNAVEQNELRMKAVKQTEMAQEQTLLAQEQTELAEAHKANVDELIRRSRVGRSVVPGVTAMKKVCSETITVTKALASTSSVTEYTNQKQRFLEFYFGAMNIIEVWQKTDHYSNGNGEIVDSPIEEAMVAFERKLKVQPLVPSDLPHTDLKLLAKTIADRCKSYLP